MAKSDEIRQLNIEQENAIDLLIQGRSDREVAEAVGVSRQTITGWRNYNPVFIAVLNERRYEIWGAQTERLRGLVESAVSVLQNDLDNEDMRLRQSAAVHILKAVGLYGADLQPTGKILAEDVEDDWRYSESMPFRELTRLLG